MQAQDPILKDTAPVAIGQLIGAAAVAAIYTVLGCFDLTVLLGTLAGAVLATVNYFLMYFFANKAADRAQNQDAAGGQKWIRLSYMARMIGLLVALVLLARSGWCNVIALAVPLALHRPILAIMQKGGGRP